MKLLRLKAIGFGSLRGEFAFDPQRVTLIVDENERGKSTLLAAICAGLYGLEGDKRSHRMMTPLERWRPWDGGPFGVELELECGGERYTVTRDFERGSVAVWNGRGQELTADFKEGKDEYPVGKKLLGVDAIEFEKCALVRQGDLDGVVPSDEKARRSTTLRARLESAADTHIGDTNASEALRVIEEALRRYTCPEVDSTGTVDTAIQRLELKQGVLEAELKTLDHELEKIAAPLDELARIGEEEKLARDGLARLDAERRESLAGEVRRQIAENEERRAELERLRAEAETLDAAAHLPPNSGEELQVTVARFEEAQRNLKTLETRRREELERDRASIAAELQGLQAFEGSTAEDADHCVTIAAEMRRVAQEDAKLRTAVFGLRDQLASKGYEPERIQYLNERFSKLAESEQKLLRRQSELALGYQTEVLTLEQVRTENLESLRQIDAQRNARRLPGWFLVALGLGGATGGLVMLVLHGLPGLTKTLLASGGASMALGLGLLVLGARARAEEREGALRRLSEAQRRVSQLKVQRAETELGLAELSQRMGYRDAVELMREWAEYSHLLEDSGSLLRAQEQMTSLETQRRAAVEKAGELLGRFGSEAPFPESLERVAAQIRRALAARQRMAELDRSWSWIDDEKRVADAAATGLKERAVRILQSAGLSYDPERPWSEHIAELTEHLKGRARHTLLANELIPQAEKRLLSQAEIDDRRRQLALLEAERLTGDPAAPPPLAPRAAAEIEAESRVQRNAIEMLQLKRSDLRTEVEAVWRKHHAEHPEKLAQLEGLGAALERAGRFKRAAELARDTIQKVAIDTHRRWADFLNHRVGDLLQSFGTKVEQLRFGEDLDFSVKFWNGQQVSRGRAHIQLSSGARDQLYLAVRLAISEYLSQGRVALPLLLDDCFASSDDDRARAGMKLLLEHFARGHQVVVTTCHRKRHEALAQLDPELYQTNARWLDAHAASPAR